ncbi:MAG: hypothetical protein U1E67_02015 [Hyphomicrobiales bacterium]
MPEQPDIQSRPSAWSRAGIGFLIGVCATIATAAMQIALFGYWFRHLPVRPDFTTNQLNYLSIGFFLFVPAFSLFMHLLVFAVFLPLAYARQRRLPGGAIEMRLTIGISLLIEAVGSVFLIGWGGTHVLLAITALPLLAVTAFTGFFFVRMLNKSLQHDGADVTPAPIATANNPNPAAN